MRGLLAKMSRLHGASLSPSPTKPALLGHRCDNAHAAPAAAPVFLKCVIEVCDAIASARGCV